MNEEPKQNHDIMSKPLPEVLDEIQKAAADARKAADEAEWLGQTGAAAISTGAILFIFTIH